MPYKHKCKNCEKVFEGRRNKQYCSIQCKNEFNARAINQVKEQLNKDYLSFERNTQILHKLLYATGKAEGSVLVFELKDVGFDMTGPFRLKESGDLKTVVVGDYELKFDGARIRYKRWQSPFSRVINSIG